MKLSLTITQKMSNVKKYVLAPRGVIVHWEVSALERHNITVKNPNPEQDPIISINKSGELIWEGTFEELELKLKQ